VIEDHPFRILYRVFLLRVVDLELLSADGDPVKLLGQLAAFLAAISMTICLPLIVMGGNSPEMAWTMEHFLIATTMLAVGLLSMLSWDNIFPDKRDVLVLGPLPVEPRTIFAAKLAALAHALSFSVLALNVFTGLLWPLYFASAASILAVLRAFAAYWITTAVAALFMFFSVLTAQGLAAQLLPRQLFLRLSAPIQMASFCLFLGVYILEPSLEAPQSLAAPQNQHLLACLPSYWFFALFQQLDGTHAPVVDRLAGRAWSALAIVVIGAVGTLLLTYRRSLRTIAEQPDILPSSRRMNPFLSFRNSLTTAVMFFCLRTVLRSRQHRILLSFYFGIGLAIVLAYVHALFLLNLSSAPAPSPLVSVPFLAASILMLCIAIAGVRIVSPLPITLRANWLFRVTELQEPSAYIAAVRRTLLLLCAFPLWLVSAVVLLAAWPMRLAFEHLPVLALLALILVELSLLGSRKLPFTCSYLPGKGNLHFVVWAFALLLLPLINAGAQLEMYMLNKQLGYSLIVAALVIAWTLIRWLAARAVRRLTCIQFDEFESPQLLSLDLDRN
jgi:hypothetical protein